MATQLKLRRGNTLQHTAFTGAIGEVTFDTEANTLVVHDGTTLGGHPISTSNSVGVLLSDISEQLSISGNYGNSAFIKANTSYNNSLSAGEYANGAYQQSNTANDNANTRVLKTGDVMTGSLSTSGNTWSDIVYANTQFYSGIATYAATLLPNTVAQFTGNSTVYSQVNHQNINPDGSADCVVTSDVGDDESFYITTGIQNSNLEQGALYPLDGYVLVQGNTGQVGGNLVIGSISNQPGQETRIVVGGYEENNVVARFTSGGANIKGNLIVNGVNISGNLIVSGEFDSALTTRIYSHSNSSYDLANTKFSSSGGTISGDVNVTGNLVVSGETVYANTTTVNLGDSLLTLNADIPQGQSPSENAGIEIDRGSSDNVQFIWNETIDKWTFTNDGINYNNVGSSSAESYANSAFDQANTADQKAVSAGSYANSAYIKANSAFSHSNLTLGYSESSYSQANTATTNAATADQRAVTSGNYANSAFDQANTADQRAVTSGNYANSAFDQANTATTNAATADQRAVTSGSYANSAFGVANTKFSSSGGTISGDVNVTGYITVGSYIDLNTAPTNPSQVEGRFFYDNTQKALSYYNDTDMTLQIGQEQVVRVWNNTASSISDGFAVYVNGSSANGFPSVAKANSASYETSEVIGITTTTIPAYGYGFVTLSGKVNGLNTSLISPGSEIYLSDSIPGYWSTTKPNPPSIPVRLGVISRQDLTDGSILVNVTFRDGANKTTGAILFAKDESIFEDPEKLFYDSTNHRLGIGTNVPSANLHVSGDGLFTGNVTISGNLLVSNAQSITTTELTVGGNTIILNSDVTGSPVSNASIIVNRGSSNNVYITWNETINEWVMFEDDGVSGHILHSEKTAHTWADYTAMATYEKLTHPIGADLSNTINEHAKAGYTTANSASLHSISGYNQANTASVNATSAGSYANSAYARANTSLQNNSATSTSGILYASGLVSNTSVTMNSSVVATSTGVTTGSVSQVTADSFATASYRTAKYIAQITSGTSYHVIELLLIHDGTTVYLTQYAETMSGTSLGTFDATITTGTLSLLFTPTNAVTTVKLHKTLIAV